MKKYDWEFQIKMNLFMMRILGLWPKGDSYTFLYATYVTAILSTFQIAHILCQTLNFFFIYDDLAAITGTIYVLLVEVLEVFKVYYLITNMKMLKQLLLVLDTEMFQPKNSEQKREIEKTVNLWRFSFKMYFYTTAGVNLFWIVYPLLDEAASDARRLPFIAWYPFDSSVSPLYEIIYVHQILSVNFISTVHVNVDAFFAALNFFNASQFDILCDNVRNLHRLNGSGNVKENLVYCVQHHREILSFAEKTNKFLNGILVAEFSVSALSIALTMFQLTLVVPGSSEFYSFVTYGVAITAQVFMYCFSGNEIEHKSKKVPYAIFESKWLEFSSELKQDLLFFTLKAQTPVTISALNLFNLSLATFMKILKTSWSYFALLKNVSS